MKKCNHKSELSEREVLEDLYGNCYFCGESLLKHNHELKHQGGIGNATDVCECGAMAECPTLYGGECRETINKKAVKFGSAGGKSKSSKKVKASRLNGKKGGRPKTIKK